MLIVENTIHYIKTLWAIKYYNYNMCKLFAWWLHIQFGVPLHHSCSNPSLTNTSVAAVRTSGFWLSVFRFHSVFSCLRLFHDTPTHNASRILFTTCSYSGKVVVRTAGVLLVAS